MTFFKDPEPIDKFLFWFYLLGALFIAFCGWGLYTAQPFVDPCTGAARNGHAAGWVCWATAVLVLSLAENRRSGWLFWIK